MRCFSVDYNGLGVRDAISMNVIDESIPESDALRLIAWFEEYLYAGNVIEENETVQVGWMICTLKCREDGTVGLFEPDMKNIPIVWIDAVDRTIITMRVQRDVAASFGELESMQIPSCRDSCLVGTGYSSAPRVVMERATPNRADSGWFIGDASGEYDYSDPSELMRKSLYEVACCRPEVVQFLSLPVRYRIILSCDTVEVEYENTVKVPIAGSYVERKFSQ